MDQNPKIIVGIAWFRSDQWELLRALAADPEGLEQTHAEWLALAEKSVRTLKKQGVLVRKVVVDVNDLNAWCLENHRPLDSAARAAYAGKLTPEPQDLT